MKMLSQEENVVPERKTRLGGARRVAASAPSPTSAPPDLSFDADISHLGNLSSGYHADSDRAAHMAERALRARSQSAQTGTADAGSFGKMSTHAKPQRLDASRFEPYQQKPPLSSRGDRVPSYLKQTAARCVVTRIRARGPESPVPQAVPTCVLRAHHVPVPCASAPFAKKSRPWAAAGHRRRPWRWMPLLLLRRRCRSRCRPSAAIRHAAQSLTQAGSRPIS